VFQTRIFLAAGVALFCGLFFCCSAAFSVLAPILSLPAVLLRRLTATALDGGSRVGRVIPQYNWRRGVPAIARGRIIPADCIYLPALGGCIRSLRAWVEVNDRIAASVALDTLISSFPPLYLAKDADRLELKCGWSVQYLRAIELPLDFLPAACVAI
jgi:hypothetical protein